jgi:hypothetical protein
MKNPKAAIPEINVGVVAGEGEPVAGHRLGVAEKLMGAIRSIRPGGAGDQSNRIREMCRAAFMHPNGGARERLGEIPGTAGVVEMDVRNDDVGEVGGFDS